jgi:hypothetical protein
VADPLNRLSIGTTETIIGISDPPTIYTVVLSLADHFGLHDSDLPDDIYPLLYKYIYKNLNRHKCPKANRPLINKLKQKALNYELNSFRGGGKMKSYLLLRL